MHLALHRVEAVGDATIGEMYLDGTFFCYTLEDVVRDLGPNGEGKVWGKTAIPAGTYEILLSFSPKFQRLMPRLMDVPFFDGILIHKGNTAENTHGCILVGDVRDGATIKQSTAAYERLFPAIAEVAGRGEHTTITITNNF
jgi:hypothetical protein